MDLPHGNASEALVLDSASDGEVMNRFLALPPAKAIKSAL